MFNPLTLRDQFPMFRHHPELVYLDSAATALKPERVIQALTQYYERDTANIARGIYPLAETATLAFEETRGRVAKFLGAVHNEEIIFTAGTTDSINRVAAWLTFGLGAQDEVIVTALEHHSGLLPWKVRVSKQGAVLHIVEATQEGCLDETAILERVNDKTRIVALPAVSNVVGVINPLPDLIQKIRAKKSDVRIVVDAAQAVGHIPVSVTEWDVDFLAFSGHKLFGPTGIGVLYGRLALLKELPPLMFGGGMVLDACAESPVYKDVSARFEAGTPPIAEVIGLGAAIRFVEELGIDSIRAHEEELIAYTLRRLKEEFGESIHIIGPTDPNLKSGIISFLFDGAHPHDVAQLLGEKGVCVRAGLQCAAPLHVSLQLGSSTRISLSVYNSTADIEALIKGLQSVRTVFPIL